MICIDLHLRGDRDFAVQAMNIEHPVYHHRRFSRCGDRSLNSIRTKRDLRIAIALEHLAMHLSVSYTVATFSTLRVYNNGSGDVARRVELQRSLLQLETTADSVEHVA